MMAAPVGDDYNINGHSEGTGKQLCFVRFKKRVPEASVQFGYFAQIREQRRYRGAGTINVERKRALSATLRWFVHAVIKHIHTTYSVSSQKYTHI
jgi:hypothetical protein